VKIENYLCNYLTQRGGTKGQRESLRHYIKNKLRNELIGRDGELFEERRMIVDGGFKNKIYNLGVSGISAYVDQDSLWVVSYSPNWRSGWKGIANELVSDLMDSFFHFLTQYIHRCNVTPMLIVIGNKLERECEWVGSRSIKSAIVGRDVSLKETGKPIDVAMVKQICCHYPPIHNACYHYLKAVKCFDLGLSEEFIVNAASIGSIYVQNCGNKIDKTEVDVIKKLKQLRGRFAAHPSGTKWWDFGEVFENEILQYRDCIQNWVMGIGYHLRQRHIGFTDYGPDMVMENTEEFYNSFWFNEIPA